MEEIKSIATYLKVRDKAPEIKEHINDIKETVNNINNQKSDVKSTNT